MSLPVYQQIHLKSASIEEMKNILNPEMNLKHPVAIILNQLELNQQREAIGLIENYFYSHNLSFKFPYPLYLVSSHEISISRIPIIKEIAELPKFFVSRDTKMNVKESQLIAKNKLLQMEVNNSDTLANQQNLESFATAHKVIFELENERLFYQFLLNRLMKVSKHG